jgi:hypothetical protein
MITIDLYNKVLIQPVQDGHDELFIVSGYTSATFFRRHLNDVKRINKDIRINLIRGMRGVSDHNAFLNLLDENPDSLSGYYYQGNPQVHSKTYCWMKRGQPSLGFTGSSNYSQYGFFSYAQQNQMVDSDASKIKEYYYSLLNEALPVSDHERHDDEVSQVADLGKSVPPGTGIWIEEDVSVKVSILSSRLRGENPVGIASQDSLNWGQRDGREPNQGCLNIRGDAKKEGFLPPVGHTFTLLTDDGKSMDCTRQQQGRQGNLNNIQ